jgi:hypothetical protein
VVLSTGCAVNGELPTLQLAACWGCSCPAVPASCCRLAQPSAAVWRRVVAATHGEGLCIKVFRQRLQVFAALLGSCLQLLSHMPILALLPSGARWVHKHEPGQELVVEKLLHTDEVMLSALPTCPATACKCQLASLTSMVPRALASLSRHLLRVSSSQPSGSCGMWTGFDSSIS